MKVRPDIKAAVETAFGPTRLLASGRCYPCNAVFIWPVMKSLPLGKASCDVCGYALAQTTEANLAPSVHRRFRRPTGKAKVQS